MPCGSLWPGELAAVVNRCSGTILARSTGCLNALSSGWCAVAEAAAAQLVGSWVAGKAAACSHTTLAGCCLCTAAYDHIHSCMT